MKVDFDRERAWWDAKAPEEEQDLADEAINRALRWREIELHLAGVRTVLDIGAGTGAFSIPLARRGFAATHVDFSPAMLALARHKAEGGGPRHPAAGGADRRGCAGVRRMTGELAGGGPMRFALSTGSLYTYGPDRVFALAAEAGFDGVEVFVDPRFDTRQPVYLRRLMERYGLPILSVHAPFRPQRLAAWPQTQPKSIAATAELARAVGAEVIIVHLPRLRERAYVRWLRNDLRAWQRAHPNPVVAVENMPLKWIRWWPIAPLDLWRMNRLEEWGAFPHLNLDTTHLATKGLDPLMVYERLRQRVVHVHLSNARREGRRIREHRCLEDGFLPLGAFLDRLAQDGYDGIVTVELEPKFLEAEDEEKVRSHLRQQIVFCQQHGGV